MNEMKSLTLNDKTYDSFVDGVARPLAEVSAVICSASGERIAVSDSSNLGLVGLNIYGRSTQEGVPTLATPVEIVSVGDDGSVLVGVGDNKNIFDTAFTSGGLDGSNGAETTDGTLLRTDYIPTNGNAHYYLSGSGGPVRAFFYTENRAFLGSHYAVLGDWFTVPNSCAFIRIHIVADNYGTDLMIMGVHAVETNITLRAIPVEDKDIATYVDNKGRMWCADEVDFARGVYVRRVGTIKSYTNENVVGAYLSSTGELSRGASVQYILATPVEIPLSVAEISAYKALHTNKPNTTIINDENAYMTVKYIADPKSYIDNKVASAILAATVE